MNHEVFSTAVNLSNPSVSSVGFALLNSLFLVTSTSEVRRNPHECAANPRLTKGKGQPQVVGLGGIVLRI